MALKALASHAVEHGILVFDEGIVGPDGNYQTAHIAAEPALKESMKNFSGNSGESEPVERISIPPPDLEIRVAFDDPKDPRRLIYTLHSYRFDYFNRTIIGDPLRSEPQAYWESAFATLEKLHRQLDGYDNQLQSADVDGELEAFGHRLYSELFPSEMRSIYRRLRRRELETILFISDEPWIPWEIVKPYDDEDPHDIVDDDYLGMRFQVTRWLSGKCPPAEIISVKRVSAMITYALPEAREDRRLFAKLAGRRTGVEDLSIEDPEHGQILEALKNGNLDMIHFAGHGEHMAKNPDESGFILSDGKRFRPSDIHGQVRTGLQKSRPFVTLNACQLGRSENSLSSLGGWAPRLVREAEVGAFVAPMWTVSDKEAHAFSTAFYEALEAGDTIGQSALVARRKIQAEGHLAFLAYAVYGHPNGHVLFGSERLQASQIHEHRARHAEEFPLLATIRNLSRIAQNEANWIAGENEYDPRIQGDIKLESVYIHRRQEEYVTRALLSGEKSAPIVLVKGIAGHGKTSLLWGLANSLPKVTEREIWFVKAELLTFGESRAGLLAASGLVATSQQLARSGKPPILLLDTVDLLMHHSTDRRHTLDVLLTLQSSGVAVVLTCRVHEARLLQSALDVSPILLGTYTEEIQAAVESNGEAENIAAGESEMVRAVRAHAKRFYRQAEKIDIPRHVAEILEATSRRRAFHDVCVNPLTLRMLFLLYAPDEIHSREINVYQLYRDFWQRRITQDQRGGSQILDRPGEDLTRTAAAVALVMLAEGVPVLERHFLESHVERFGGSSEQIGALLARGALLESHSMIRFFHQSFLEHAAAQGFVTTLKSSRALLLLTDRVIESPGNLFLTPVLEQALLLSSEQAELRRQHDIVLQQLLDRPRAMEGAEEASLLLSGLYVYTHTSAASEPARKSVEEILREGSPELVEDFLDLIPNVNLKDRERIEVLLLELELVWNRHFWPKQKKILEFLRHLLPLYFEPIRRLFERWGVIRWAAERPGSNAADQVVLNVLALAIDLDSGWVFAKLVELYQHLETQRRQGTKGTELILQFMAANAGHFPVASLPEAFEEAVGWKTGRLKPPLIEAWGQLWATEWQASKIVPETLFSEIGRHRGLALDGRLNGLARLLIDHEEQVIEKVFNYVESLEESLLQAAWSRIALARLVRGNQETMASGFLPSAVEAARRAVVGRLKRASYRTSEAEEAVWIWSKVIQEAQLPANAWRLDDLLDLSGIPFDAWLDPARGLGLLAPAAAAGLEGAQQALKHVMSDPGKFPGIVLDLARIFDKALQEGLDLSNYSKQLAIAAGAAGPLLGLAERAELRLSGSLEAADLRALILRTTQAQEWPKRRDGYLLWSCVVRDGLLEPPRLDEIEACLVRERSPDAAKAVVELLEQSHRRSKYPIDDMRQLLSAPRFQNASDDLGEAVLRFHLRVIAEENPAGSRARLGTACDLALTLPTNPERLGMLARVLMPYRREQASQVAEIIERVLDAEAIRKFSKPGQFSVRSRFLVVARDAFGYLALKRQKILIARVPEWPETLGGLIVDAATKSGSAGIWEDLEALGKDARVSPKLKRFIADRHRFEESAKKSKHWIELYDTA